MILSILSGPNILNKVTRRRSLILDSVSLFENEIGCSSSNTCQDSSPYSGLKWGVRKYSPEEALIVSCHYLCAWLAACLALLLLYYNLSILL